MDKKLTKEQQKEIAIARMKQMDVYAPYIKEFEKNQTVTLNNKKGGE